MERWNESTTVWALLPVLALLSLSSATTTGCASNADSKDVAPAGDSRQATAEAQLADWPPRLGSPYPDVELHDSRGVPVRMSSFKGKVLLIEPIGMTCPACIAFAGGNRDGRGGLDGLTAQGGLDSIERYVEQYAGGARLDDPDLVFIHLLLYGLDMHAPTQADARRWKDHFGVTRPNHLVLYADESFINPGSYGMIPGFQLVDRDFILRSDATGHHPTHSLYTDLLPLLGEELKTR